MKIQLCYQQHFSPQPSGNNIIGGSFIREKVTHQGATVLFSKFDELFENSEKKSKFVKLSGRIFRTFWLNFRVNFTEIGKKYIIYNIKCCLNGLKTCPVDKIKSWKIKSGLRFSFGALVSQIMADLPVSAQKIGF